MTIIIYLIKTIRMVNFIFNLDCRPTFVWMFITPGTSYPNANESMEIRHLHLFKNRVIKNHEERRSTFLTYLKY